MVPILKAKPDASLQDSPAQGHLCHQQTDFSVTQGATKYCLNPESPDHRRLFPHLQACLWACQLGSIMELETLGKAGIRLLVRLGTASDGVILLFREKIYS